MRALLVLITLLILGSPLVIAQEDMIFNFDPNFKTISSRNHPAKLGGDFKSLEFNVLIPHAYVYAANNAFSYKRFTDVFNGQPLDNATLNEIINDLGDENGLSVGGHIQLLSGAFTLGLQNDSLPLTFIIGATDRFASSAFFGKNLFKLLYEGNKQFAGEEVNLGPFKFDALYHREYYAGASLELNTNVGPTPIKVKPAARVKYLTGIVSANTSQGDLTMFTEQDGKYIDFGYNINLNSAAPWTINLDANNTSSGPQVQDSSEFRTDLLFSGTGTGWGFDLGIGLNIDNKIQLYASMIDIGSIDFKTETVNYTGSGETRYSGINVNPLQFNEGQILQFDSLSSFFNLEKSENNYSQKLPTKFLFQASYHLGPKARIHKKKGTETLFHSHNLYLSYHQGLENYLNASSNPFTAIGYTYNFRNVLTAGLGLGYGGFNKLQIGPHIGVNVGPLKFGLGSNNITPLIISAQGSGLDAHFVLSWSL